MQDKETKDRMQDEIRYLQDPEFLMRDEMRSNRLALEFAKADLGLRDEGIKSTVVVFGSSRAMSPRDAKRRLKCSRAKSDKGEAKLRKLTIWYELAREFGKIVSERGGALASEHGIRDNVITTGGGPGIMEAANRGASDAGAPSIGFNIRLPTEQRPNKFQSPSLCFHFHYFAIRKMHFAMRANALAVFPGGFGTMDELFEILTLKQTRKTPAMPIILFDRSYWEKIVNFQGLADHGTIDPSDLKLFRIVDSAEEGWEVMVECGLITQTPLHEA